MPCRCSPPDGLPGGAALRPLPDSGRAIPLAFVEGERQNLCNAIAARINDKRSYAVWQLLAAMCADEPYGIPRLGDLETAQP
ncbi:MAG: hypothetical protein V8S89_06660 [Oscillospiraceae bacterium]